MNAHTTARIQAFLSEPAFEMAGRNADHGGVIMTRLIDTTSATTESAEMPSNSREIARNTERQFITSGDAIFTIVGKTSRYTYRATISEPDANGRTCTFLSLLAGPDNLNDYVYVGLLDTDHGVIKLTRKSRMTADSGPVKALGWVLTRIWRGADIQPARIYHVGRCGRCGRALTVPASIESGFGPECMAKMGGF